MAHSVPFKLRFLRIKPKSVENNSNVINASSTSISPSIQCSKIMNTLLSCWRSNGIDSESCSAIVKELATCNEIAYKNSNNKERKKSVNFILNKYYRSR